MKNKNSVPFTYRQGDCMLLKVNEIPASAKVLPRVGGRVILAEGEISNHFHAIADEGATMLKDDAGQEFLSIKEPVELRHEEHDTIALDNGNYKLIHQKEYHPEAIRNVVD